MPNISHRSYKILVIISSILVIVVIFTFGVMVGFHNGRFDDRWERHYSEVIGPVSHGAVGQVISINYPSIVVRGPQEAEKVIIIGPDTMVRRLRNNATTSDITVGSWIVALGSPDEKGQINATLIRITPPPPLPPEFATSSEFMSTSTMPKPY